MIIHRKIYEINNLKKKRRGNNIHSLNYHDDEASVCYIYVYTSCK